jgi:hypothetical protein
MSYKKRYRNSISLSPSGNVRVRVKLSDRALSQEAWASFCNVSVATAKRLLRGERIDVGCFQSLIKELELELESSDVVRNVPDLIHTKDDVAHITSSVKNLYGVLMTGRFNLENRPQINLVLDRLRELMINAEFTFEDSNGSIVVSGSFPEDKRSDIQILIKHLESLMTSSVVTW